MIACPSCGREAVDDFAFCPYCGTPLAEQQRVREEPSPTKERPLAEERKVVTTLFCDLVGFTALSEAADHENVDALLRAYADCARRIVESHGGVVEKFIGDAVVAVFGFPAVHDDDPERAVHAGLKIAREVPALEWPGDAPLAVRVGINTGETYVHLDVGPASGETFITGDVVNTAARLQAAAPPGGLVVGELTHGLTEKAFLYEALEPLTLKGKAEPVKAWLAREPRARTGLRTSGSTTTPFLGRQGGLDSLQEALHSAADSHQARFCLLVGEPGIGKSRLVLEFARSLEEQPDLVTWRQGRCLPYGEGVAFWALGEIVKAHAGILDSDALATVDAKLEAVLPAGEERTWLRQRLHPLLGLEAPQASREENFAAWTRFLEIVVSQGPAVLVLEDLHWADEEMLAFVERLSGRSLGAPLLVIGTTRPELLDRRPDTLDGRQTACIALPPLDRSDVIGLAAELLGGEPTDETADAIIARAGGNPLYVEEYVRLLADSDLLRQTPRGIEIKDAAGSPSLPDSLQGVIGARLDLLSPTLRATLADAAVLGESFWRGGVAAVGGLEEPQVEDAMSELEAKHLVRPAVRSSFAGEAEYVFWHALVRDVAYGRLPRKVRVVKHAAAARWVERTAGDRARELAEILAYHYATAFELAAAVRDGAAAGLRDPALHYLTLAGERTEPLDVDAAEHYYSRAIDITPEPTAERFRLMARRAGIATLRGRLSEAAAEYEAAAAGLREAGDTRAAAAAMTGLSDALATLGDLRYRDVFAAAVELAEIDAPSPVMVAVLLNQAAAVHEDEGPREALEVIERATAMAESLGLPEPVDALDIRGRARCTLGDAGGLDDLRRGIEAAEREGRRVDQAGLLDELAWCLVSFEGPTASLQALEASRELSRRSRMEGLVEGARSMAVRSLYWAGEWDTALAECQELAPILEGMGDAWGLAIVRYVWSLLLLGRGDVARAEPLAALALDVARDNPIRGVSAVYLVAAAAARHGVGDDEAAFALLEECRESLRGKGDTVFVYLLPLAVRTALAAGNADLARRLADGVVPVLPFSRHVEATLRAQVLEIEGDVAEAAAAFAAAASRWHDFGIPYEEAQALFGQGRCLVALGRAPEAAPALEQAREIFAGLKAKPALDEVDALLAGLPATP